MYDSAGLVSFSLPIVEYRSLLKFLPQGEPAPWAGKTCFIKRQKITDDIYNIQIQCTYTHTHTSAVYQEHMYDIVQIQLYCNNKLKIQWSITSCIQITST